MDVSVTGWKDDVNTAQVGVKVGRCLLTRHPHPPPPNEGVCVNVSANCQVLPGAESRPSEVPAAPLLSKAVPVGVGMTHPIVVSNSADSGAVTV